jgi:hypothetical protein
MCVEFVSFRLNSDTATIVAARTLDRQIETSSNRVRWSVVVGVDARRVGVTAAAGGAADSSTRAI